MARITVALAPARPTGCQSLNGLDSPYQACWDRSFVPSSQQSGSRPRGPAGEPDVSVSASVGSHGNLDHVAGSAWVALVEPPACVVMLPQVAPVSRIGADVAVCLTGAAELGVDVAGPSLPVGPLVATVTGNIKAPQVLLNRVPEQITETNVWDKIYY